MSDNADEITYKGPPADLIQPEGEYVLKLKEHHRKGFSVTRDTVFLRFVVALGEKNEGLETFQAFNVPRDNSVSAGSKYYKTWTALNGRPPSRNATMSWRPFHGHYFLAKVTTHYLKNSGEAYSKAEIICEVPEYASIERNILESRKMAEEVI